MPHLISRYGLSDSTSFGVQNWGNKHITTGWNFFLLSSHQNQLFFKHRVYPFPSRPTNTWKILGQSQICIFFPIYDEKGGGSSFCTNKYVGSLEATACYVKQFHQHWPQCATLCSTGDLHLFPQLRSRRPCPVRASQGMCTWNPNHPCFSVNDLFFFGGCQPSKNRAKWVPRRGHIKSMFG